MLYIIYTKQTMSVAKLEKLLRRLEDTKDNLKMKNEGGFFGLSKKQGSGLTGGGLTGGSMCKCQGGKKPKCGQCGYVKCRCAGGVLVKGGEIEGFEGAGMNDFAGGRSCGAGLTGGRVRKMKGKGLTGGQIEGFEGSGLTGGAKKKGLPPQLNKWMSHVQSVKAKNPSLPYKDVLKLAKQTY